MLAVAGAFGLVMGAAGTAISATVSRAPTGALIVLVGTCLFGASALFAPRRGAAARWVDHVRFRRRLREQAVWRAVYEATVNEAAVYEGTAPRRPAAPPIEPLRPIDTDELVQRTSYKSAQVQRVLRQAERTGLLTRQFDGRYLPTTAGLDRAARVTRGYRLWERFMSEQPELTGSFARLDVESADEVLSSQVVAELEAGLRALGRLPTVPGKGPSL